MNLHLLRHLRKRYGKRYGKKRNAFFSRWVSCESSFVWEIYVEGIPFLRRWSRILESTRSFQKSSKSSWDRVIHEKCIDLLLSLYPTNDKQPFPCLLLQRFPETWRLALIGGDVHFKCLVAGWVVWSQSKRIEQKDKMMISILISWQDQQLWHNKKYITLIHTTLITNFHLEAFLEKKYIYIYIFTYIYMCIILIDHIYIYIHAYHSSVF